MRMRPPSASSRDDRHGSCIEPARALTPQPLSTGVEKGSASRVLQAVFFAHVAFEACTPAGHARGACGAEDAVRGPSDRAAELSRGRGCEVWLQPGDLEDRAGKLVPAAALGGSNVGDA